MVASQINRIARDPRGFLIRFRVPRTAGMDAPCFVNVRVLGGTHKNTMADTDPNAHADVDADMDPITTPWQCTPSRDTRSHAMAHELGRACTRGRTSTWLQHGPTRTRRLGHRRGLTRHVTAHNTEPSHTEPRHVTTPHRIATLPWRKDSSGLILDTSRLDCVLLLLGVTLLLDWLWWCFKLLRFGGV